MLIRTTCCTIGCLFVLTSASATAQLVVPATATVALNGGAIDLGDSDLQLAGVLTLGAGQVNNAANVVIAASGNFDSGSGTLTLSGDWSNAGVFSAGTGTVNFADGVAASNVSGDSTFNNASFVTATGKTYAFAVGSTQTINGTLTILGTSTQPIQFTSTAAGQVASINLAISGTQNIHYVGVSDVHGSGQQLAPGETNDGGTGNDLGWFGNAVAPLPTATPVPTLSRFAQALLALLLAATVICRALWRRHETSAETLP